MSKLDVNINDKETNTNEVISTNGVLVCYLDANNKIKITGKIDTASLMPLIAKTITERMTK